MTENLKAGIKNIVLVHGAFADGSGWEDVYNILKNDGYRQNPTISLEDDVAVTKRMIAAQNGPVILVGHSSQTYWWQPRHLCVAAASRGEPY